MNWAGSRRAGPRRRRSEATRVGSAGRRPGKSEARWRGRRIGPAAPRFREQGESARRAAGPVYDRPSPLSICAVDLRRGPTRQPAPIIGEAEESRGGARRRSPAHGPPRPATARTEERGPRPRQLRARRNGRRCAPTSLAVRAWSTGRSELDPASIVVEVGGRAALDQGPHRSTVVSGVQPESTADGRKAGGSPTPPIGCRPSPVRSFFSFVFGLRRRRVSAGSRSCRPCVPERSRPVRERVELPS